jgi:cytochrome c-type biogenesis protein CcmE
MVIEEHFDADEILRDVDERYEDDEASELEEEMRELNFGTLHDENANFKDMAHDLDTTGDLWE